MKISILGGGWLGRPLAHFLIQKSHKVRVSARRTEALQQLRAEGLEAYHVELSPQLEAESGFFVGADVVVANIPPSGPTGQYADYPLAARAIAEAVVQHGVSHLIWLSSTGVYPELQTTVYEMDAAPHSPSATAMLQAEAVFAQHSQIAATVLRPAGLIGPDRHPGRFFAGRKGIANGRAPVNLVHLDDVMGIVAAIVDKQAWGHTFNAVAAQHPTRAAFYTRATQHGGMAPPEFVDELTHYKIVSHRHTESTLSYVQRWPDPMRLFD